MTTELSRTTTDVVARLIAALGEIVSIDPTELDETRMDRSGHRSSTPPLALVHARTVDDVQQVMRIATATATPVVTRGAGTGLAGGAIASTGEIVLSTARMTDIIEVSVDDEFAVVQAGIINADLNAALADRGLWFAPDPASRAISTVGGNIATNAGGLLCAKYGVTREAVLGLKIVLADGRLLELGSRTVKGVTGLDLTSLLVGSEGTLGVIVEATVRLRRTPRGGIATIGAWFDSVEAGARAASVITSSGLRPAVMELLDPRAMRAIAAHLELAMPDAAYLLVNFDGESSGAEAEAAMPIISSLGGRAELTTDAAASELLFATRRAFHPALVRLGTVLIEDVCVPRSALPAMFHAIGEIEQRFGLAIPTVAHAGDGNLHPNFVFEADPNDPLAVPEHVWAAADEMFVTALRLGGTLTGEHGVGILKKRWLGDELGGDQLELQRQIKSVFDPLGILNPGKVF